MPKWSSGGAPTSLVQGSEVHADGLARVYRDRRRDSPGVPIGGPPLLNRYRNVHRAPAWVYNRVYLNTVVYPQITADSPRFKPRKRSARQIWTSAKRSRKSSFQPASINLDEPLVEHSQRERLLNAMARSCAKKGYGATTIADVCEGAGVSRATFYELFKDKEDCFHASMEVALADAMGRIVAVYSPDKPWAAMVRDAAAAFLDLLASRPTFARMALVEAPASGERAFELYASGKRVLQSLLERGPRRSGRGTGDPIHRRPRCALCRRVADRRPDPRRQHGATARAPTRHRLHHDCPLSRPGGGAAPGARGRESRCDRGRIAKWQRRGARNGSGGGHRAGATASPLR